MSSEQQAAAQVKVKIGGSELSDEVASQLTSVDVDNDLHLPDFCELRFEDPTLDVLDRSRVEIGKELEVLAMTESSPSGKVIFSGEVTSLDVEVAHEQIVSVIRAFDKTRRLQHGTVTETYLKVKASDVVSRVAKRRGLQVGKVDATKTKIEALVQWNRSDWDFLQMLALESGRELNLVDGKINFTRPVKATGSGSGSPDTASPTELVAGRNLLQLRATQNSVAQVKSVEVRNWDGRRKKAILGSAQVKKAMGTQGQTDPGKLASNFGKEPYVAIQSGAIDDSTAKENAEAIADRLGSLAAELEGETPGNPALRAGTSINLSGVGKRFSGAYRLTSTHHYVDAQVGYVTGFRVSGDNRRDLYGLTQGTQGCGSSGTASGITPAVVSNIDDPEKLGRVKVAYKWLAERSESDWSRVLIPGGGPDRGFVALPEVGDEVVVAFDHGDPRHALVLGGLFNSTDKLPERAKPGKDVPVRLWRSRQGHRIEFDDSEDSILVSSAGDKVSLTLSEKDAVITIDSSGKIEITAQQDVSVETKAGLTMKASGSMKVEATGSLELKGNGVTVDAGGGAFDAKGVTAKVAGSTTAELSGGASAKVGAPMVQIN